MSKTRERARAPVHTRDQFDQLFAEVKWFKPRHGATHLSSAQFMSNAHINAIQ